MKGYGDLEAGGLGYGDPTPLNPVLERGYGSPSQIIRFEIAGGSVDVSHLGGSEIRLIGLIPRDLQPYRASIEIGSEEVFLYSGQAGQGYDLNLDRDALICFSPPAPVATYDLKIRYGASFLQEIVLSNAVNVRVRNRSNETYLLRSLFPSHYNTGARTSLQDKILDGSIREQEQAPLSTILNTAGILLQELSSSPMTVLTSPALRGATLLSVESVLGFASSGRLWLGSVLMSYTLQNNSIQLNSPLKFDVAQGEEIVYHAYKH